VVKRLVQGSDTAIQGDVEVNDVVVKVRAGALQFIARVDMVARLQVDGHPVKGWDEKALLAHVMGEEGKQLQLRPKLYCTMCSRSSYSTLKQPAHRHVLQHRV
jgi:hypothetical protein